MLRLLIPPAPTELRGCARLIARLAGQALPRADGGLPPCPWVQRGRGPHVSCPTGEAETAGCQGGPWYGALTPPRLPPGPTRAPRDTAQGDRPRPRGGGLTCQPTASSFWPDKGEQRGGDISFAKHNVPCPTVGLSSCLSPEKGVCQSLSRGRSLVCTFKHSHACRSPVDPVAGRDRPSPSWWPGWGAALCPPGGWGPSPLFPAGTREATGKQTNQEAGRTATGQQKCPSRVSNSDGPTPADSPPPSLHTEALGGGGHGDVRGLPDMRPQDWGWPAPLTAAAPRLKHGVSMNRKPPAPVAHEGFTFIPAAPRGGKRPGVGRGPDRESWGPPPPRGARGGRHAHPLPWKLSREQERPRGTAPWGGGREGANSGAAPRGRSGAGLFSKGQAGEGGDSRREKGGSPGWQRVPVPSGKPVCLWSSLSLGPGLGGGPLPAASRPSRPRGLSHL